MYKIETHLHTPHFSSCADMPVDRMLQRYREAGYAALTVTEHYNLGNFRHFGVDPDAPGEKLTAFLEGYRQVRRAAEPLGIRVYYGAELRFAECFNDYLLYGFSDELLADPLKVCSMSIVDFAALARQDGAVLFQAHPFRKGCVPIDPHYLDGVEVANRHPRHLNRNELALDFAQRHGLLQVGGSDYHHDYSLCAGGILAQELPQDSLALAQLLRSQDFVIL